jgi:hypothetical protein
MTEFLKWNSSFRSRWIWSNNYKGSTTRVANYVNENNVSVILVREKWPKFCGYNACPGLKIIGRV